MTPELLREFQSSHLNHLGRPLAVDGVQGPQTEWALDVETLCAERRAFIFAAQLHLGLVEVPPRSNDDPAKLIRKWLLRAGAMARDPWCAAFVCAMLESANVEVYIAGAQRLGRAFPAVREPLAGDLFWFPTGRVTGHVGIVIGTSPTEVMAIEGNCANAVRATRRPRLGLEFSRPIENACGTSPGVVPSVLPAPGGTR